MNFSEYEFYIHSVFEPLSLEEKKHRVALLEYEMKLEKELLKKENRKKVKKTALNIKKATPKTRN